MGSKSNRGLLSSLLYFCVIIPFTECDMNRVAETFVNLSADVFPYPDDMARRSHFHDLAVVGNTVESGVDQQPSFAEHRLDVEWHLYVGGVRVLVLQDYCIEFQ